MKRFLSIIIFMMAFTTMDAQINVNASLGEVFRDFMVKTSGRKVDVLQDFTGFGGDNRFFSMKWLIGGATNNFDTEITKDFYFNFDFLEHELHVKRNDTNIIANTNYVKRFFILNENRYHYFVKNPEIDSRGKLFFEAIGYNPLIADSLQVKLLKLRKVKKLKANKEDYLNNFNGDFSDVFHTSLEYYLIFPDKRYKKIKLNLKEFKKAFPQHQREILAFEKQYPEINEQNFANLIISINNN